MKRYLVTFLRLMIAVAGVAFIAWSLTWADQLHLPAGYELSSGAVLNEPVQAELLTDPAAIERHEPVVVEMPTDAPGPRRLAVPPEAIGTSEQDVRYEPGVLHTLRDADWTLLAAGLLLVAMVPVLQALRWWLLMVCRELDTSYLKSLRLSLVGMFFNFSLPGMTGGDLVKAYYAAKGSANRGAAVMSVVFDRVTGLIGLILLAAFAGLASLEHPLISRLTGMVWIILAVLVVGGHLYMSQRVRKRVAPIGKLLVKVTPGKLLFHTDQAAAAYGHHMRTVYLAVLVSLPTHGAQMVATGLAGQALGMEASLLLLIAVLPIVFFAGCIPISYQGLGVMEAVAMALLLPAAARGDVTTNQVVGMLLLARLYILCYAMLGALVLMRGGFHLFPHQTAEPVTEPEAGADGATATNA